MEQACGFPCFRTAPVASLSDETDTRTMAHVGAGAGDYVIETEFKYVGAGAGDHIGEPEGGSLLSSFAFRAVCAALLAAGLAAALWLLLPESPGRVMQKAAVSTTSPPSSAVLAASARGRELAEVVHDTVTGQLEEPHKRFNVLLDHSDGERFGFRLTSEWASLYIDDLVDDYGLVTEWNKDHPEKLVKSGDRIVEVNGLHGRAKQVLDEVDQLKKLNLTLLRVGDGPLKDALPVEYYDIRLDRTDGESFGADCAKLDSALLIKNVTGGLFGEWNKKHPDRAVHPGDRVVEVNGIKGSSERLLTECSKLKVLKMKLMRAEGAADTAVQEGAVGAPWGIVWKEQTSTTTTTSSATTTSTRTATTSTSTDTATHTSSTRTTSTRTSTTETGTTTSTRTLTSTTTMPPFVSGLKAEFFYHIDHGLELEPVTRKKMKTVFSREPDLVRIDPQIYYPLTTQGWAGVGAKANFAARWRGQLLIKKGGRYTFELKSDDGSALLIDEGDVLADAHPDFDQHEWAAEPKHVTHLSAGGHDLEVTYFNTILHAGIMLFYKGPDTHGQLVTVPPSAFRARTHTLPADTLKDAVYLRRFEPRGPASAAAAASSLAGAATAWAWMAALVALLASAGWSVRRGWRVLAGRAERRSYTDLRFIADEDFSRAWDAQDGPAEDGPAEECLYSL